MAREDEGRVPNPVDRHIGARIRERRRAVGMSQERLAERLGITFQQVQKYERGSNRVSASRLFEIASAIGTPIGYFFEHLAPPFPAMELAEPVEEYHHDFVMTHEGAALARTFPRIPTRRLRRQVLDLVRALAPPDEGPEDA